MICSASLVIPTFSTDKNGKTVVSYVKHTVSTVAGTSSKSASTTVTNTIVNATPLGWINLAVNVVGHAATNLHIHKMWKDQTKRFDALETIMTDVRKAVENAEERMINTVKSEIDGLKVEMNTAVKNLSDVVKGEFDNHRIEALSASTKQLFSYLNGNYGNWDDIKSQYRVLENNLSYMTEHVNLRDKPEVLTKQCTKYELHFISKSLVICW